MSKQPGPIAARSPFDRDGQRDAKRLAILAEAARLFNRRGSRSTTLLDIASSLNLSKTSLYYYVKTKQELIYQTYLASCEQQARRLAHIDLQALSGLEKLRKLILDNFSQWRAIVAGEAPHYALLLEIAALKPSHREDIEQRFIANFKTVRRFVLEGIADATVAPCDATSTALCLIGTLAWSPLWLLELKPNAIDDAAVMACDILLHGLYPGRGNYPFANLDDGTAKVQMPDGFDAQAHKLRKREAFLTAGSYFFNTKGFKGTSLDEIANHLQVTKGAFYYHIKDKEDLLLQCFERSLKLTEAAQNLAQEEADTGIAQVEIVCRQIFYLQNSGEGPLIRYNNLLSLATGHQAQIKRRTRQTSQQFGNFIDAGCIDGSIRPINANVAQHMLAGAIMASMDVPLWKSMGAIQPESIAYFHLFFNGLQRRPTTPTELP